MTTEPVDTMTDTDDAELARRAGLRDGPTSAHEAFRSLYERHAPRTLAYVAARLGRADAEEALGEVWERVRQALGEAGRFDGRNFPVWSLKTAHAVVTERLRNRPPTAQGTDGGETTNQTSTAEPRRVEAGRREALGRCLETLKSDERAVAKARFGGMGFEEIAERGKVEVGRVHQIMSDAREKLRACVDPGSLNLLVLELPDEQGGLTPWIDRRLAGLDLAALVAELEALHAVSAPKPLKLDAVLGESLPDVLQRGLEAASGPALVTVLRNPRLLLDLQARALAVGGAYWQELNRRDPEVVRGVEAVWGVVEGLAGAEGRPALPTSPGVASSAPSIPTPPRGAPTATAPPAASPRVKPVRIWPTRAWALLATVAASTVAFLYTIEHLNEAHETAAAPTVSSVLPENAFAEPGAWGWNRPGALAPAGDPQAYFRYLADAVGEWFDEQPATPEGLGRRLAELRGGCTLLIVSDHVGLSPADKAWLVEQSRAWAAKIDETVRALEQGNAPSRVRGEADETVKRLIDALKERARSAA